MNSVNKTLYIPLYGKAFVSKKGILLKDKKAEEIWEQAQFPLKRKSKSKWLAYTMAMRAAVFDSWVAEQRAQDPSAIVLQLGCGLDSRIKRVGEGNSVWVDVDFPSVIEERKKYFSETERYQMLGADIKNPEFMKALPKAERAIVVLEGVSMYLTNEDLKGTLAKISEYFPSVCVLVDCYTPFAAKMSKLKNPVSEVGVAKVYGLASECVLEEGTLLRFVKEHEMTPKALIEELSKAEQWIFKRLYAGKTAKKLYKIYEYEK